MSSSDTTTISSKINSMQATLNTHASKLNTLNLKTYSDSELSLLGITSTSPKTDFVNRLPAFSQVTVWINDNTSYGTEIRTQIKTAYGVDVFGYLTVTKTTSTVLFELTGYDRPLSYIQSYSAVNSVGWSSWMNNQEITTSKYIDLTYSDSTYISGCNGVVTITKKGYKRCDIDIRLRTTGVTAVNNNYTQKYYLLSTDKIAKAFGMSTITWNALDSSLIYLPVNSTIYNSSYNSTVAASYMGLSGLMLNVNSSLKCAGPARVYTVDGGIGNLSVWTSTTSPSPMYTAGSVYYAHIVNASYT